MSNSIHKNKLLQNIIKTLTADLNLLTEAAKTAHAAATHAECLPDNKYDTTGLEASYVAQGQANRAQDIRQSLDRYRKLTLRSFDEQTPIRLTAVVTLEADDGSCRQVFLGPDAGGLKLADGDTECIVITPESPLGRAMLGRVCDDEVYIGKGASRKTFTIVAVA
jgi:transcription elongation GreA/GreB family factor